MTDIVERLRGGTGDGLRAYDWMNEAADEIERLREQVSFPSSSAAPDRLLSSVVSVMVQAAEEIEELRAERDMWRQENLKKQIACEQMGARIVTLEAERDAARREGVEAAALAAANYQLNNDGCAAAIRALLEDK